MSGDAPRVFIFRHGQTEWSKSGQYTGTTDLPLLPEGVQQVKAAGSLLIGQGRLIDPIAASTTTKNARLAHVYVSPRLRARQTFEIAFAQIDPTTPALLTQQGKVSLGEERLAEWEYGDYEGLLTGEIRRRRQEKGLDSEQAWDIWRDGCEGGESPAQVTARIDSLIEEIRTRYHTGNMRGENKPCDIVLVAHGHLLRAFVKRWLGYPLDFPLSMMIEPAGVGVLSYQHHNIEEPGFLVGVGYSC